MLTVLWLIAVVAALTTLAYRGAKGSAWAATIALALAVAWVYGVLPGLLWLALTVAFVLLAPVLLVAPLRRALISDGVLKVYKRVLPAMSQTEQDAIDAGTVWWDGELFSGQPDWARLFAYPQPKLSAEEERFLDVETDELCRMTSDWATTNVYQDLPPE